MYYRWEGEHQKIFLWSREKVQLVLPFASSWLTYFRSYFNKHCQEKFLSINRCDADRTKHRNLID